MNFLKILSMLLVLMVSLFFMKQKKWLSILLILESVMMLCLMNMIILMLLSGIKGDMFLVLLTFAVCEAALGLTLLINYVKMKGSDLVKSN
uniref:NADH dehydrogenase subunit 4L n=1 Tax=Oospira recedens TaxID=1885790 RepID=A0A347Z6G0_9EUPU|nr:NADH dehydrogenase subunit 4L [Oospira recedens]